MDPGPVCEEHASGNPAGLCGVSERGDGALNSCKAEDCALRISKLNATRETLIREAEARESARRRLYMMWFAIVVSMILAWVGFRHLNYNHRELVLMSLSGFYLLVRVALANLPSTLAWCLWSYTLWGIALGVVHSGDIGEYGHYGIGALTFVMAFLGMSVGLAICVSKSRRNAKGKESASE
jgi:hypothetical protein